MSEIVLHSDEDYVVSPNAESVWITVAGLSVYIHPGAEGLTVDVYPRFDEGNESVVGTWVTYDEVQYSDEALEQLWDELEAVGINDDGITDAPFLHFPSGIDREDIWHWFDGRHSKGVAYLLNERDYHEKEDD